jgi:2-phospho-L-lactate/phosphoenolpyruvate guanylyltransferase
VATLAILPIKNFDLAKQRLADEVPAGVRRALAQAMCADVLLALRRASRVDAILVVSGELDATAIAAGHGIEVVDDPDDAGQSAAAGRGIARALERGVDRVLLVPGDAPALDPVELDELLDRTARVGRSIVIVPDRHGTGTNGLILSPPDVIEPAFGEGSFERHRRRAEEAGVQPVVEELASLGLDVDTPEDLAALRASLASARIVAPNMRGMLRQLDHSEAPPGRPQPSGGASGDGRPSGAFHRLR